MSKFKERSPILDHFVVLFLNISSSSTKQSLSVNIYLGKACCIELTCCHDFSLNTPYQAATRGRHCTILNYLTKNISTPSAYGLGW